MRFGMMLFIFPIIFTSCSKEVELIGSYKADRYSFLEMAPKNIFQKTGFVANCTLELKDDSTFVYHRTCNTAMEGYWSIKSDSLILDVYSHKWIVDSIQKNGINGHWLKSCFSETFRIEGDLLFQIRNEDPAIEGDYRVFTRLKKLED